jgi:hypothetical protein
MVEFDVATVLAWLGSVAGLTAAQIAVVAERMAEDQYEGAELVGCTAKILRRLLKDSDAEEAIPALLAARDACLAAEQTAAAQTEQPSKMLTTEETSNELRVGSGADMITFNKADLLGSGHVGEVFKCRRGATQRCAVKQVRDIDGRLAAARHNSHLRAHLRRL